MSKKLEQLGKDQKKKNADSSLKDQFEKEKNKPLTRDVILKYKSCCGCGCSDVKVKRTVPYDSELQDGDRIDKPMKGDRAI